MNIAERIQILNQENQLLMAGIEKSRRRQREIQLELTNLNDILAIKYAPMSSKMKDQILSVHGIESKETFGSKNWFHKILDKIR